jgi:hypothetical protein
MVGKVLIGGGILLVAFLPLVVVGIGFAVALISLVGQSSPGTTSATPSLVGLAAWGIAAIPAFLLFLFLSLFVSGYLVRLARNVIAGAEQPLPEWANWAGLLLDGLKVFAIEVVLAIPNIVVTAVFNGPRYVAQVMDAVNGTSTSTGAGVTSLGCLGSCLSLLVNLAVAFITPVVMGRLAATGSIGAALHPGQIWAAVQSDFVTYLVVFLLGIAAGLIGVLGIFLCAIGLPFTQLYASLVNYHLYGQAYRKTQSAATGLGQPWQPAPQSSPF